VPNVTTRLSSRRILGDDRGSPTSALRTPAVHERSRHPPLAR